MLIQLNPIAKLASIQFVRRWQAVLFMAVCWWPGQLAHGFTLNAAPGPEVADLIAEPQNFYSWDKGGPFNPIRYGFDASLYEAFPHPLQRQQIHLAFSEWTEASGSVARRSAEANYHWNRVNPGAPNFWDLRTLASHEIGHVLGAGHPDASWFNTNPDTGAPYNLNYRLTTLGQPILAAPLGGELMNEGNGPGLPNFKPPKGFRLGEYNRKVSKDELEMIDYAYGSQIHFEFVGAALHSADIVVSNFQNDTCDMTLGSGQVTGGGLRDLSDSSKGGRILAGHIYLRDVCTDAPGDPTVGFTALSRYWQITNQTDADIVSVLIDTFGTDNTDPTSEYSIGPRRMTKYDNFLNASVTDGLERILHQWSNPVGGAVGPGESTKIALQQDVWDWTVSNPRAITSDAQFVPVALVNTLPFTTPQIQGGAQTVDAGNSLDLLTTTATIPPIATKGILLSNDTSESLTIERVLLAPVGDINPQAIDEALLDELDRSGRFSEVQVGGATWRTSLSPSDEFYLLLEGDIADLPGEVLQLGNFIDSRHEGWMDEPLIAAVIASNGGTQAISYSLMNTGTFVPEPTSIALCVIGLIALNLFGRTGRKGRTSAPNSV